ncbi:hypothetical protein ASC97_07215 [Rhizobium sp. Root1203]|nr:hypothetical protein ASC97_07215 [Rhizobium sp. Root1203]
MHRTDDEHDRGESLAGPSPSVVGPPREQTVIPFRRTSSAAVPGSAAGGDPPSPPASFQDLGSVTQAVVMRLANKRIRLKVLRAVGEEIDDPER